MTTIPWLHIVVATVPALFLIALKLILDLRLAPWLVKYLHLLPVRNYLRDKPINLRGTWEHIWGHGGSVSYPNEVDRHGHSKLLQLGSFIYAEYYSQGVLYAFFGQIKHGYVVGDWFDVKDHNGYFGVFQLEISNSGQLKGLWLGHSKKNRTIRSDTSQWNKVDN